MSFFLSLCIDQNLVLLYPAMMKPGESINVSIVLSNDGTYDDFIIDVKDQLNLLTTYSPQTISLNQGHNITIVSTFSAPAESNNHTSR